MNLGFTSTDSKKIDTLQVTHTANFEGAVVDFTNSTVLNLTTGVTLPDPLQSIADLTTVANEMLYTTNPDIYATTVITSLGRDLVASATPAAAQGVINTVIDVDVQAHSATLDNFSGIAGGAAVDQLVYNTGPGSFTTTGFTGVGRDLVGDSTTVEQRATLDVIQRASTATTDNAIAKWNGVGGDIIQNSGVTIDASNNIAGVVDLSLTGTLDGIDASERTQLANIGVTTISASQWANVGAMNQNVDSAASPSFAGATMTADISMGTNSVLGLPTPPPSGSAAASKDYVDSVAGSGLVPIESVAIATAAVLPNSPAYASPAETLTSTGNFNRVVDGIATVGSERVLVKEQADDRQNGIYTVTTAGSGAAQWVLTRAADFNQAVVPIAENTFVFVVGGLTLANSQWLLDHEVTIIDPHTDSVTWD